MSTLIGAREVQYMVRSADRAAFECMPLAERIQWTYDMAEHLLAGRRRGERTAHVYTRRVDEKEYFVFATLENADEKVVTLKFGQVWSSGGASTVRLDITSLFPEAATDASAPKVQFRIPAGRPGETDTDGTDKDRCTEENVHPLGKQ